MLVKRRLEIHPFALLFPMADDSEMKSLREDIRKHGVRVPIVLYQGKVLDGRSRYLIASEIGKAFPVEDFYGTPQNALELAATYNL